MVGFTVDCELPLSPRDMWRIRSSAGFRHHVVEDGLMKRLDASGDKTDSDGWTTRTQRYVPAKVDFPDFLRTVIGDAMFDVTDEQRFNDAERPFCQNFRIKPTMFAALSTTSGTLTLYPVTERKEDAENGRPKTMSKDGSDIDANSSDGFNDSTDSDRPESESGESDSEERSEFSSLPPKERCVHSVKGDTKVNLPTVGWLVERSIVHNLRLFYRLYPATVWRFRQKVYQQFAGGDSSVPCSVVIDRFLKHEEETESVSDGEGSPDVESIKELSFGTTFATSGNPLAFTGDLNTPAFPGDMNGPLLPFGMAFGRNSKTLEEDFESFFVSA